MKTGTYKKATIIVYHHGGGTETADLLEASLTTDATGMAEITHYIGGHKTPCNKRTTYVPITRLIVFQAEGYAN